MTDHAAEETTPQPPAGDDTETKTQLPDQGLIHPQVNVSEGAENTPPLDAVAEDRSGTATPPCTDVTTVTDALKTQNTSRGKKTDNGFEDKYHAELEQKRKEYEVYIAEYAFPEIITKSGKKKLIKKLKFEFFKKTHRKMEREKMKRKRAAQPAPLNPKIKVCKLSESSNKLRIAIDCSFDDQMLEKDIVKLSKQVQRCYTMNRHMSNPLQLHLTNLAHKTLDRFDTSVDGYKNWDVIIKSESLADLFKPDDVVYLCAESENTLSEFDESKVYVIGGFVDHNLHKGLAYERAVTQGFGHARLPIDSYFKLATRKVLAVCHVFEIISNFVQCKDWEEAISNTVPKRKGLTNKDTEEKITEES